MLGCYSPILGKWRRQIYSDIYDWTTNCILRYERNTQYQTLSLTPNTNQQVYYLDHSQDVVTLMRVPRSLTLLTQETRPCRVVVLQMDGVLAFRDQFTMNWSMRPHYVSFLLQLNRVSGLDICSADTEFSQCGMLNAFGISFISTPGL